MKSCSYFVLIALVPGLKTPLPAQTNTSSIRGVITDPSGSVIPDTAITIEFQDAVRIVHSDPVGRYQITGLLPGVYNLHAVAPGFAPYEATAYEVLAGRAQLLDIRLPLRAQAEQVTVAAGDTGKIDTDPSNNASALVLRKTDLDALPDDPDDLAADLQALAGPAAGPSGGQIFVDGFIGGRLPPKQSIREIRLNQNPFAAQFDKPGQGRVEILTKPGTDQLHAELLFRFSDALLNSRNPFLTTKPPYQRRPWEGEASGPINRKTSFYFDFERRDIRDTAIINALTLDKNLNAIPILQAIVTPLSNVDLNFRIDRQLTANHTLTGRYSYARDEADNQGVGGFNLASTAYNEHDSDDAVEIVETGVLSERTINETRFRFRRVRTDQGGGTLGPITTVPDAFTSGASPIGTSYDHQRRFELQNFTSYIFGAHSLWFGGIMRAVELADQAMRSYGGTFIFTSLDSYRITQSGLQNGLNAAEIRAMGGGASQFTLSAGNPWAALSQFESGFFVQDEWRVSPNLSVSAGVRYEFQTHANDWSDIAPRVGFAWAVGRNTAKTTKNVIRGGFGLFYERISESLALDARRQNGVSQQVFRISNPDFYPFVPAVAALNGAAQPQTIRETDAGWHAPTLLQAAIGVERQVTKSVTVSSNFVHTTGTHALRSRNINAPQPTTGFRPYGGLNGIYLYEASGIYRQNQWITNLNIKVNSKSSLSAYYTLGSAMSNTDGAGTFPANQYDLSSEYGRAGYDVRHRFQLTGSFSTKSGFRFSPFLTITSGRPYNITLGKDLNGDGLYTDRPASGSGSVPFNSAPSPGDSIIPRNYGQGPDLVAANLKAGKTFKLGEGSHIPKSSHDPYELTFSVAARNILNHPNYALPVGNLSSPFFGQSLALVNNQGSSSNRRIDLEIRFAF